MEINISSFNSKVFDKNKFNFYVYLCAPDSLFYSFSITSIEWSVQFSFFVTYLHYGQNLQILLKNIEAFLPWKSDLKNKTFNQILYM